MNALHFSPEAAQDLNDIYDYLVQHSPAAAARTTQALERACRLLARLPGMGTACDDLRPGMRKFPSGRYVIFYRPTDDGIEVVRILHGARDFPSVFNPP
jgi:toxin ParE1/3/4